MGGISKRVRLLPAVLGVAGLFFAAAPTMSVAASDGQGEHQDEQDAIYVSPSGSSARSGESCATAKYSTIGAGVTAASKGDTVHVCAGTYSEMVTVTRELSLVGSKAIVDATGQNNGFLIKGQAASETVVRGFTVQNAIGEGILAMQTSEVTIQHNTVKNNDQGATDPNTSYAECKAFGQIPGDCGEGVHLMSVWDSSVWGNDIEHNAGGILVTDEVGPAHDNTIAKNTVSNNGPDCGITLPSHSSNAVSATGKRQPKLGGVYHNIVKDNVVENNGAGGVLFGGAGPGAGAYENTVTGNHISGNGLPGIAIHDHTPGQDFNGNNFNHNVIGTNGTPPGGEMEFGDLETTGIIVGAHAGTIQVQIEDNKISDNHFGIFTVNVPANPSFASDNTFKNVTVPVSQS
jgi:Periplasmic copper-binding protein (NosD)